MEVRREGQE
uniref:Uncharacterized protein n=1 Tax=Arundo donax TaxID=35708 RepID=A0A0A9D6R4_ARUDO